MSALYATLRLVWRPLALLQLGLVWVVVAFLLQIVPDVSEVVPVLRALWLGAATPGMLAALWVVLVVGPAGAGIILAVNRIDLQHTTASWHLPALRRRLLSGTIVCGLLVAAVPAVLVARNDGTTGATLAAFSVAFAAFGAPGFWLDTAVSRAARVLAALPMLAAIAWPTSMARLAHDSPLLVAALAGALAGWQLYAIRSDRAARLRPFRWSASRQSGSRTLYWSGRKVRPFEWRQSLATNRLLPWLRAAARESETRYPLAHLGAAAVTVLMARLLDLPQTIPLYAGSFLLKSSLQLRMPILYPLSRVRRAQLAYLGTVIDAATYFLFAGVLLYVTALVPLPRLPSVDWESPRPILWVLAWGGSLALAPVAQWHGLGQPTGDRLTGARLIGFLAWLLGYAFLVVLAAGQINVATRADAGPERALAALLVLLLVVQAIHAVLVFGRYTRGDLAGAPATYADLRISAGSGLAARRAGM